MPRPRGLSVRLKLALSYAIFLMVAGVLLIAVVWLFLLRYVPDPPRHAPGSPLVLSGPGRLDLWRAFAPRAAQMAAFLLAFALLGGWWLAGRMLAPLKRITEATRRAADGLTPRACSSRPGTVRVSSSQTTATNASAPQTINGRPRASVKTQPRSRFGICTSWPSHHNVSPR